MCDCMTYQKVQQNSSDTFLESIFEKWTTAPELNVASDIILTMTAKTHIYLQFMNVPISKMNTFLVIECMISFHLKLVSRFPDTKRWIIR